MSTDNCQHLFDHNRDPKLEKFIEQLESENKELKAQLVTLSAEYSIVIRTVIKTLYTVGLWPITDKIETGKLIKTVSNLALEAMNPMSNMKERFSFIKDIIPVAEKYKDIDINEL